MSDVTIFAPSPTLTVTVENSGDADEIHIHAGGQGVWQARMLCRLGVSVTMCCTLAGEVGQVIRHLLEDDGVEVVGIDRPGRASAYVQDRRGGEREEIGAEVGDPIARHELDELYGAVIREGMRSRVVILSGPAADDVLPPDTYRRLAADLRASGCTVVVDLAGDRLDAALEGGVDVLKVSDEEMRAHGLDDESPQTIAAAMRSLRSRGAGVVIVTRAEEPLLLLDGEGLAEITPPKLEVADSRGAGDSLTAGVVAGMVRGETPRGAITLGAAAGAMNVTRHGLGTGDAEAIAELRKRVRIAPVAGDDGTSSARVSPDGLASLAETEEER
ncbi:1-phosphofructokinase [Microbacterium sp. W4I4]|uniref:1-phosphofructokinase family hexose kinase n=1 Tax=Microbacterium sp. W4I4 TaxID=3042295 RepID=UPI00277FF49E|nr:PfkB family carbohydrate kinase [Microbacterium sp. W4I4]MDQ0615144.1 1-phosphofructokinase [Microbacterium sp. W4I4]